MPPLKNLPGFLSNQNESSVCSEVPFVETSLFGTGRSHRAWNESLHLLGSTENSVRLGAVGKSVVSSL